MAAVTRATPMPPPSNKALKALLDVLIKEADTHIVNVKNLAEPTWFGYGNPTLTPSQQLQKLNEARLFSQETTDNHARAYKHKEVFGNELNTLYNIRIKELNALITQESSRLEKIISSSDLKHLSEVKAEAPASSITQLLIKHMNSILIPAIKYGEGEIIQGFIAYAPNILRQAEHYEDGCVPVLMAAKYNQQRILADLLIHDPESIHAKDKTGKNIFHYLAQFCVSDPNSDPTSTIRWLLEAYPNCDTLLWQHDDAGLLPIGHAHLTSITTPLGTEAQLNSVTFLIRHMNLVLELNSSELKAPESKSEIPIDPATIELEHISGIVAEWENNLVPGLKLNTESKHLDSHSVYEVYEEYTPKGVKCVILVPESPDDTIKCYFLDNIHPSGIEKKRIPDLTETAWPARAQFISNFIPRLLKKIEQLPHQWELMGIGVGGADALIAAQMIKAKKPGRSLKVVTFNSTFVGDSFFSRLNSQKIECHYAHTAGFIPPASAKAYTHCHFHSFTTERPVPPHLRRLGTDMSWSTWTPLSLTLAETKEEFLIKTDFNKALKFWPQIEDKGGVSYTIDQSDEKKSGEKTSVAHLITHRDKRIWEYESHWVPYSIPSFEKEDSIPSIDNPSITFDFHALMRHKGIVIGLMANVVRSGSEVTLEARLICRGTSCPESVNRDLEDVAGLRSLFQRSPIILEQFITLIGKYIRTAEKDGNPITKIHLQSRGHSLGSADGNHIILFALERILQEDQKATDPSIPRKTDFMRGIKALTTLLKNVSFVAFNHPRTAYEESERMAALAKYFHSKNVEINAFVIDCRIDPVKYAGYTLLFSLSDPKHLKLVTIIYDCTWKETLTTAIRRQELVGHQGYLYRVPEDSSGNPIPLVLRKPDVIAHNQDEKGIALLKKEALHGLECLHPVVGTVAETLGFYTVSTAIKGRLHTKPRHAVRRSKAEAKEKATVNEPAEVRRKRIEDVLQIRIDDELKAMDDKRKADLQKRLKEGRKRIHLRELERKLDEDRKREEERKWEKERIELEAKRLSKEDKEYETERDRKFTEIKEHISTLNKEINRRVLITGAEVKRQQELITSLWEDTECKRQPIGESKGEEKHTITANSPSDATPAATIADSGLEINGTSNTDSTNESEAKSEEQPGFKAGGVAAIALWIAIIVQIPDSTAWLICAAAFLLTYATLEIESICCNPNSMFARKNPIGKLKEIDAGYCYRV
jgi:hypothetical protein